MNLVESLSLRSKALKGCQIAALKEGSSEPAISGVQNQYILKLFGPSNFGHFLGQFWGLLFGGTFGVKMGPESPEKGQREPSSAPSRKKWRG